MARLEGVIGSEGQAAATRPGDGRAGGSAELEKKRTRMTGQAWDSLGRCLASSFFSGPKLQLFRPALQEAFSAPHQTTESPRRLR